MNISQRSNAEGISAALLHADDRTGSVPDPVDEAEPSRNDRVDTIMIKDPEGNSIAFAEPTDPTLAR
ncbi:MAG TPA: hypothetical protein VJM33_17125 [Microthrixaceae bacterium]|nr:hypothetical protein [Microthrixaceae bacterium]